jgi:SPP1 family holin
MQVKTDTIIRTIILIVALCNQVLSATGHSILPISDDQVETLVTTAVTIAAALWSWWKNNSFSAEAIKADGYLETLRADATQEEAEQ